MDLPGIPAGLDPSEPVGAVETMETQLVTAQRTDPIAQRVEAAHVQSVVQVETEKVSYKPKYFDGFLGTFLPKSMLR